MGISGLLPLLRSIQKPCDLKKFQGQTLGVDGYGWLHRGTAGCAIELALGQPTTKYVDFFMNRVRMLIHFGVTPYIVFDGDNLPSKAGTEKGRREKRNEGKRLGLELLKVGKTYQAHQELQKSVDVTPEMARMTIEELKHNGIQYIVAPYEADSQLAYLEQRGIISGVLSEDSDLLVFGVKCLITKLDKYGECIEVNRNHFTSCAEVNLVGWSDVDFRRMAILSGCDYLAGIGGLGLKTAHRMLRKHKTVDRLVKAAHFDKKLKVPADFMTLFEHAERTFLYQWVFCPLTKQLVNLNPLEDGINIAEMPYLGEKIPADVAIKVAQGELYPRTKLPISVALKTRSSSRQLNSSRKISHTVQTPDAKGSKPIDSFFAPKRTPLAELDPNVFTPSPSQQVLLQQQRNNNGWEAVPAPPSQPLHQTAAPSTAPQPVRRTISAPMTNRRSVPNSFKRQRLCSDSVSDLSGSGVAGIVRSHFFASPMPEPSPSLRQTKSRMREKETSFELYSDDVIPDDMMEAADLEETGSQPKKKMKILGEKQARAISESQSTTLSRGSTTQSLDTCGTQTPASSYSNTESESLFSATISSQIDELRSRFVYKRAEAAISQTSESQALQYALHGRPFKRRATSSPILSSTVQPLPRTTSVEPSSLRTPSPSIKEHVEIEDSAWATAKGEVVVAASSPTMLTPKRRKSSIKGSEDLLVPDSEAESECSPRKPLFNLSRFSFTE